MVTFDKKRLLEIAKLSALKLYDNEIDGLVSQIKKLLDFTQELEKVKLSTESSPIKNINIFREDVAKKFDSSRILGQAPKVKENFFVVPKILKKS